jgi:hypothetical protein
MTLSEVILFSKKRAIKKPGMASGGSQGGGISSTVRLVS